MKYLDYSKLPAFMSRYFPDFAEQGQVGRLRQYLADYVNIQRFHGPDGIKPINVSIKYQSQPFELTDPLIGKSAKKAIKAMRKEGRLYDGPPSMKLVSYDFMDDKPTITVQPTNFGLNAGTCLALDMHHSFLEDQGGTLRDYYRRECAHPTVENNPLAICLGVSGILVVDERGDRYLLLVRRSPQLASLAGTIGPSVAGVVDYSTDFNNLAELIDQSLGAEIEQELNLHRDEYEIDPLAWAIELFRGERPQIFCLVRTLLDRASLAERMKSIPSEKREFDSIEFVPLYAGVFPDQKYVETMNFEARMNFYLAEELLGR